LFKLAPFHAAHLAAGQHFRTKGVFFCGREAQNITGEAKAYRSLPTIRQHTHQPRSAFRQRIDIARVITLVENRCAGFQRHSFAISGHIIQRGGVQRRAKPKGAGSAFHADIAFGPKAIHHRTCDIKRVHVFLLFRFAFAALAR